MTHPTAAPTVLFDLDGTVWDSLPGIVACLAHALDAVGLPVPDDDVLASNVGPPLLVMLAHFGVPEARLEEAKDAYRDRYRRAGEFECTPYPGVPELLDELRDAGLRLATATSKGIEPTLRMLDHFDLARRFDVVAAASMDASAHHKVDVIGDALDRLAHDRAGTDPRVTMVGDRHYDIDGGRHFGLRTIGVTWGYGSAAELTDAGADVVVDDPAGLRAALLGWEPVEARR